MNKKFLFLILLLFASFNLYGFSSPNVPIDDPVYRYLDKLAAAGLIPDIIYAQRPWSRAEIARMIETASAHFEQKGEKSSSIEKILDRLKREYPQGGETTKIEPLEKVEFNYTIADSPFRAVPSSNGLGRIDAVINPFFSNKEGRHFVDGNSFSIESAHSALLSPALSFYLRPRFETLIPNTGSSQVHPHAQELYGKFAYRKFELQAGRSALIWGQGAYGGGIISNNVRPIDMIRAGNGSPSFLPSFLKYLGPSKFNFFVANLGPEREFPNSYLLGAIGSIKPVTFFEISVGQMLILGGDGAVPTDAGDAFLEFWGARSRTNDNISDRMATAQGRLSIPPFFGMQLYQEFVFEDLLKEPPKTFQYRTSYITGVYFPLLPAEIPGDFRIEYKHFPAIAYRHEFFSSGWTLNHRFLGDELGPDADAVYAMVHYDLSEKLMLPLAFSYENRDSDDYLILSSGGDITSHVRTADHPTETRIRLEGGFSWVLSEKWTLNFQGGAEQVFDAGFAPGNDQQNLFSSLSLKLRPF